MTFYTQPPADSPVLETKIISQLSKEFDIDSLFKEESDIIESMDDTRLIVDGVEMTSNEPTKVNFEELERVDEEESSEEEEEDDEDENVSFDDEMSDGEAKENGSKKVKKLSKMLRIKNIN